MKLNLGCSTDLRGGDWVNVDIMAPDLPDAATQFQRADLTRSWPWPDSSVDEIYAADIFEHLPDRIHTMNEAHRVLKPGGVLDMECPDAAKGAGAFQDPQHVSFWTPNALQYYTDGSPAHKRFAAAYGITARFAICGVTERAYRELAAGWHSPRDIHDVLCDVWKFNAVLKAVK